LLFPRSSDHVRHARGKTEDDEQDQKPRPRTELTIERPPDEPSDTDADQKLGGEPESLGECFATGPIFGRPVYRLATGFHLAEPFSDRF
jgi:hypothetical protein